MDKNFTVTYLCFVSIRKIKAAVKQKRELEYSLKQVAHG